MTAKPTQLLDNNANILPLVMSPKKTTKVATTKSSIIAFGEDQVIRVVCDAAANIRFSSTGGSAAATDLYMPAGRVEYFKMKKGHRVSVLGANLYYDEFE